MKWHISIFSADGKRLIFAAKTDRNQAYELAREARRSNTSVRIFLRSPTKWMLLKKHPCQSHKSAVTEIAGRH
jgi:hypothetical protein